MAQADVLRWVQSFAWGWTTDLPPGLADQATAQDQYPEVVIALAQDPQCWTTNFTLTASPLDAEIHPLPDDCVRLLALFYDREQLSWETRMAMDALDPAWRDRRHHPQAYITDEIQDREIRLWPPGDHDCEDLGWLYTRTATDLPFYYDLPLAFRVLAREFSRESAHRDLDFAKECDGLATRLLGMLG